MSAEIQNMHEAQLRRWQIHGHTPVYERGTVRLNGMQKSFPKDLEVTVLDRSTGEYRPLMLTCGRPLKCSEVLPERADLALDEEGHVLTQGEFEQNYSMYLNAFAYPYGSDPNCEPVPNVVDFIRVHPDPYGESRGMVEIGWDAKLNQEFSPKQRFGPNGETEEEWRKAQNQNSNDISAALKILAENQVELTRFLKGEKFEPAPEPLVGDADPGPEPMAVREAVEATAENDHERAPCGKSVRKGYVKQHMRHCKNDGCGDESVNSSEG